MSADNHTGMADWEQRMRTDFGRYHEIRNFIPCADSVETYGELDAEADEITTRWDNGSHAQDWAHLEDATADFQARPETMTRLLGNVEHDREHGGLYDTVTDVEYRSLKQAQEVTAPQTQRRQVKGLGMQA